MNPRELSSYWSGNMYKGKLKSGAGGATRAFNYANGRRIIQISEVIGFKPYPGSLNIVLDTDFDWAAWHLTGPIDDVIKRPSLDGPWAPRQCHFYPVNVSDGDNGVNGYAMRFESERYSKNFIEVVAYMKIRSVLSSDLVEVRHASPPAH